MKQLEKTRKIRSRFEHVSAISYLAKTLQAQTQELNNTEEDYKENSKLSLHK